MIRSPVLLVLQCYLVVAMHCYIDATWRELHAAMLLRWGSSGHTEGASLYHEQASVLRRGAPISKYGQPRTAGSFGLLRLEAPDQPEIQALPWDRGDRTTEALSGPT